MTWQSLLYGYVDRSQLGSGCIRDGIIKISLAVQGSSTLQRGPCPRMIDEVFENKGYPFTNDIGCPARHHGTRVIVNQNGLPLFTYHVQCTEPNGSGRGAAQLV